MRWGQRCLSIPTALFSPPAPVHGEEAVALGTMRLSCRCLFPCRRACVVNLDETSRYFHTRRLPNNLGRVTVLMSIIGDHFPSLLSTLRQHLCPVRFKTCATRCSHWRGGRGAQNRLSCRCPFRANILRFSYKQDIDFEFICHVSRCNCLTEKLASSETNLERQPQNPSTWKSSHPICS